MGRYLQVECLSSTVIMDVCKYFQKFNIYYNLSFRINFLGCAYMDYQISELGTYCVCQIIFILNNEIFKIKLIALLQMNSIH